SSSKQPAAAAAGSWVKDEGPLAAQGLAELGRLVRRATPRWAIVALLTMVVAGLAGFKAVSRPPEFSAEVVLRMVQAPEHRTAMSTEQLRDHIWEEVFTGPRLLAVIRQFNLSPRWAEKDPSYAVGEFRDAINVTIFQNDLISGAEIRHSARVGIGFRSGVRQLVLPVTRALAELLIDSQGKQRRATLEAQLSSANQAVQRSTAQANDLRKATTDASSETAPGGTPVGVAIAALRGSEDRLRIAQTEAVAAAYRLRAATEGHAVRFEEVNPGREPPLPRSPAMTMLLTVLMAAAVAFPVCLLLVGAFDPYLAGGDDAVRAGIPVLGIVPGIAGPRPGIGDAEKPSV
ncbi:MAG: hypothetical protein QOI66_1446, partial [Myxococcales bacterium]|nr:hypothetical protein [Myxococcales bacterium]